MISNNILSLILRHFIPFHFRLSSDFYDYLPIKQPLSNWKQDEGYEETVDNVKVYPLRAFGTGEQFSLVILLRVLTRDVDSLCGGPTQGFKVLFHPPNERPQIWKRYFQVSPGKMAFFTISPNVILTMPSVKKYSPNIRQCYFNTERSLRFFKEYTQRNCETECLSNYTVLACDCAKFSMPSKISFTFIDEKV